MNEFFVQTCRLCIAGWLLNFSLMLPACAQGANMERMLDQVSNSNWNNVPVSSGQSVQNPGQMQGQMGMPAREYSRIPGQMQGQMPMNMPGQMPGQNIRGMSVGGGSMVNPPCYTPPGVGQRLYGRGMQQQAMPGAGPFQGAGAGGGGGGFLNLLRAINQGSQANTQPGSPEQQQRNQSAVGAVKYELSNATSQASKAEFYCGKAGYGNDKGARRSNANEARYAANNARACADRAYSRGGSIPECQSYVSQARAQANRAEAAANRASSAANW